MHPEEFRLIAPAMAEAVRVASTIFAWGRAAAPDTGAVNYRLQVSTTQDFGSTVISHRHAHRSPTDEPRGRLRAAARCLPPERSGLPPGTASSLNAGAGTVMATPQVCRKA